MISYLILYLFHIEIILFSYKQKKYYLRRINNRCTKESLVIYNQEEEKFNNAIYIICNSYSYIKWYSSKKSYKYSKREGNYLDLIENYLLTDNNSIQEFYVYTDNDDVFYTTSFYADKNTNIDSVISKVKQLPINLNGARIDKSGDIFLALSKSFETMDKIVNMMLIGSAVIGVVILSLILTFWIQGRIHETGILLSIGVSKFKIIAQYISELLIISALALSLSYLSGQLIAQNVGDSLSQKAANETVQSIKQVSGGQQRVAIARALVANSPIILADEPTGNLDSDTASEIVKILKLSAHEHGKCVIVVTHSKDMAKEADVILRLKNRDLVEI